MDLIFETRNGKSFTVEVWFLDTVSEIKEKIQNYHPEIPSSHQTLIFNGKILPDDWNIEKCELVYNSRVQLKVSDPDAAVENDQTPENSIGEETMTGDCGGGGGGDSSFSSSSGKAVQSSSGGTPLSPTATTVSTMIGKKVRLSMRLTLGLKKQSFIVETMMNATVGNIKEKIHKGLPAIPINRMKLIINGNTEMQDQRCIGDYNPVDGSEIDVVIQQLQQQVSTNNSTSAASNSGGMMSVPMMGNTRKIKICLDNRSCGKKLTLDINPNEKVQVMKSELERQRPNLSIQLPVDGFFFIFGQKIMDEKESLQWHGVRQGDTIEIFKGRVSSGGA